MTCPKCKARCPQTHCTNCGWVNGYRDKRSSVGYVYCAHRDELAGPCPTVCQYPVDQPPPSNWKCRKHQDWQVIRK